MWGTRADLPRLADAHSVVGSFVPSAATMGAISLTVYELRRDGADRLLFLLHGWSAEQHHLAAYVPLVDPGERFSAFAPRGPYDLPEGDGASWYERGSDGIDTASFVGSVEALEQMISDTARAEGVALDRCVVGGFSQGGALTLALAGKSNALPYAGLWAMCCALPEVDGLDLDFSGGAGRPALVQYGERDVIIRPERTQAAASALEAGGWLVATHGYDMAHSQTIEMMVDARSWLADIA